MPNLHKLEVSEEEFSEAFRHHAKCAPLLTITINPVEAWYVMSALQLACRHPAFLGESGHIARSFARRLQGFVAPGGVLAQVAEAGWNREHDTAPEPDDRIAA